MGKLLYQAEGLSFAYPGQTVWALEDLCFSVAPGSFTVVCGPSGCGKTTLLRQLKPALAPKGRRQGRLHFDGEDLENLDLRRQSAGIGFVAQDPDSQLVTDKVWHELAFGLENLGLEQAAIRRRVAETAAFFGMEPWFHREVSRLSGGQKQLLNLASAMVLQPRVLLLDEPTGQLDPIAASDFLAAVERVHRELGTTVILTEHQLDQVLPMADQLLVLDGGRLVCQGPPVQAIARLRETGHAMFRAMPAPVRVWAAVPNDRTCPLSVRQGRDWLADYAADHPLAPLPPAPERPAGEVMARLRDVWFRYGKQEADVLRGLDLEVRRGELAALVGGNGAGKTTALSLLSGQNRPQRGTVELRGTVGALPQDPKALFARKTVREELEEVCGDPHRRAAMAALCGLEPLLERHPYDLSGGEQQRTALAKVLLGAPDILLLDEPTKGLDPACKQRLAEILKELCRRGTAVVMVSHDLEFCGEYAQWCVLLFDGTAAAADIPRRFFAGSRFYTTAANRMAREQLPEAVTAAEVIGCCGGAETPPAPPQAPEKRPLPPERTEAPSPKTQRRGRRLALCALLALVPLTIWMGMTVFRDRKYLFTALLVLLECTAAFLLSFERRRPQAREVAVIAVLCALGVAGRAAFSMLPQCKPVIALTVLTGAALGGESGFLVGAVTMLASNVLFGQGPWTPWQMFALGLIGLLAGALFHHGPLPAGRAPLAVFGAVSAVGVYGIIMNTASALMWQGELTWGMVMAYWGAGLPMDLVQAAATALYLWFLTGPVLEKLGRLQTKYGILTA